MDDSFQCWMSHGDSAKALPQGFEITAQTDNTPIAAIADYSKKAVRSAIPPGSGALPINGAAMIRHFLFDVCGCEQNWTMKSFSEGGHCPDQGCGLETKK